MLANADKCGYPGRRLQFDAMTLTVIEGNEMDQALFDRDLVRQGDGIESAGTDDKRSHAGLLVLTG